MEPDDFEASSTWFVCKICKAVFPQKSLLLVHRKSEHLQQLRENIVLKRAQGRNISSLKESIPGPLAKNVCRQSQSQDVCPSDSILMPKVNSSLFNKELDADNDIIPLGKSITHDEENCLTVEVEASLNETKSNSTIISSNKVSTVHVNSRMEIINDDMTLTHDELPFRANSQNASASESSPVTINGKNQREEFCSQQQTSTMDEHDNFPIKMDNDTMTTNIVLLEQIQTACQQTLHQLSQPSSRVKCGGCKEIYADFPTFKIHSNCACMKKCLLFDMKSEESGSISSNNNHKNNSNNIVNEQEKGDGSLTTVEFWHNECTNRLDPIVITTVEVKPKVSTMGIPRYKCIGEVGEQVEYIPSFQKAKPRRKKLLPKVPLQKVYCKPKFSYDHLIFMALKNSEKEILTYRAISTFISHHFPFFKSKFGKWRRAVHQCLVKNPAFLKLHNISVPCSKPIPSSSISKPKRSGWSLNPTPAVEELSQNLIEVIQKNMSSIISSMLEPQNLYLMSKGLLKNVSDEQGETLSS